MKSSSPVLARIPAGPLSPRRVTAGDVVFIAVALLHKEYPRRDDFTIDEILERVARLDLSGDLSPQTIVLHVYHHCVANREPKPARLRMLYAPATDRRRLLQRSDDVHPERTGRMFPEVGAVPPQYEELIAWAKDRYARSGSERKWLGDILGLAGAGAKYWRGRDPDEYVRSLREGWE